MANFFYNSTGSNTAPYDTWAKAATSIATVAAAMAAGDNLWVGDDSNESVAGAITVVFPGTIAAPNTIYCVDHTVASPGDADRKTGVAGAGSITTTGTNAITISGHFYMRGVFLACGTGSGSVNMQVSATSANHQTFEDCTIALLTTNGSSGLLTAAQSSLWLKNTTIKFSNAAQTLSLGFISVLRWTDTATAVDVSVATPTTLFGSPTAGPAVAFLEGLDLSNLSGKTLFGGATTKSPVRVTIKDCKVPASITFAAAQVGGTQYSIVDVIRCANGGTNYVHRRHTEKGILQQSTAVLRTGGASDGGQGVSWQINTTARARWNDPFEAFPISVWNVTTGSTVAVVIEGIADPQDFSALPLNDDVWCDVEYLGTSGNPLGVTQKGTKASGLATGSALTASTQAWDAGATARANSTAYSLGDVRKVASNPGRLFVCTTAGTSAGSEPGGYATAADGDSITDNTAVFKAMWRFKQTITTGTVQLAGPLKVVPKVAKQMAATSNGIFIDPLVTIAGVTIGKTFIVSPGVYVNELGAAGGGAASVIGG